jgi:hypothetical protein
MRQVPDWGALPVLHSGVGSLPFAHSTAIPHLGSFIQAVRAALPPSHVPIGTEIFPG